MIWVTIFFDVGIQPQVLVLSGSLREKEWADQPPDSHSGMRCRGQWIYLSALVGYDELETKKRRREGKRNGDKLLHGLAPGCLQC